MNMFGLTKQVLALTLSLLTVASAQSVYFTQYPNQILEDGIYPVSWEAGGAPVNVDLLRNGAYLATLYSGTGESFVWDLDELEDISEIENGGTGLALQITPQGDAASAVTSGEIWLLEDDDDGLVIDGQVITASVPWGPASAGLSSAAPATPPAATAAEEPQTVATAATITGVADSEVTETAGSTAVAGPGSTTVIGGAETAAAPIETGTATFVFTSAQGTYTFTTETPAATGTATQYDTVTFTSDGLTFETTIARADSVDAVTAEASSGGGGGGGGGISGGAIAGIVIGVLVLVLLVVGLLWFRRRRQRQQTSYRGGKPTSRFTAFIKGGWQALSTREPRVGAAGAGVVDDEKSARRGDQPFSPSTLSEMHAPHGTDIGKGPSEMEAGRAPVGTHNTGSSFISSEIDGSSR